MEKLYTAVTIPLGAEVMFEAIMFTLSYDCFKLKDFISILFCKYSAIECLWDVCIYVILHFLYKVTHVSLIFGLFCCIMHLINKTYSNFEQADLKRLHNILPPSIHFGVRQEDLFRTSEAYDRHSVSLTSVQDVFCDEMVKLSFKKMTLLPNNIPSI